MSRSARDRFLYQTKIYRAGSCDKASGALQASSVAHDVYTPTPRAGGGRLLKTLLCLHDHGGLVVVKV